jgi:hypothetical protein
MNLDVTPVGSEPGARASEGAVLDVPPAHDPFGSRPTVRRRGWIRILVGVALVVGGIVGTVVGIGDAIGTHDSIEADAVGRGTVSVAGAGLVTFAVPSGERRDYTVYLLFDGIESNSTIQELAVRDTGCVATMPDGVQTTFRGARQGVSQTVGHSASVGHFSSQPGRVNVQCSYTSGTLRSQRRRPDAVPYVVTPGKPTALGGGVVTIIGGVFGAIVGGFLVAWGWRRRRPV